VKLRGRQNRGSETIGGVHDRRSRESIADADFLGERRAYERRRRIFKLWFGSL